MIKCWAQEILGYQCVVIQRSHKMIKYVYSFNSFYETEISTHIKVSNILRQEDKSIIPEAYDNATFHTFNHLQHIGNYQACAINTITPPILGNNIIRVRLRLDLGSAWSVWRYSNAQVLSLTDRELPLAV